MAREAKGSARAEQGGVSEPQIAPKKAFIPENEFGEYSRVAVCTTR